MASAIKDNPRIRACLREGSILLFEDWVRMGNDSYSLRDAVGCSFSQHGGSKRGRRGAVLAIEAGAPCLCMEEAGLTLLLWSQAGVRMPATEHPQGHLSSQSPSSGRSAITSPCLG